MTVAHDLADWTSEAVLAAAREWVWVPDGALEARTEEYHLVGFPEWFAHPTQLARCRSTRSAGALLDEVVEVVRGWGRSSLAGWVGAGVEPADLENALVERGGAVVETVAVLGYDLARGLPDLPAAAGHAVRVVEDEAGIRQADAVARQVWEPLVPDDEALARELAELARPIGTRRHFHVVVHLEGELAAAAGCTLVDGGVARLWGAATVPRLRGRGAYSALLLHRMAVAREHGATLALVQGRVETSAPILLRAGFTDYGRQRLVRVAL